MSIEMELMAASGPFFGFLVVLASTALAHPDPQVRGRAERLLAIIFRAG
ncbi:hypothetical protein [Streptomyces sp. MMS24-I29]